MTRFTRVVLDTGLGAQLDLSSNESAGPLEHWLIDLDGWYGGVGVLDRNTKRPENHGYFPEANLRTGRAMTLKGLFAYEDDHTRNQLMRFLSGILGEGQLENMYVTADNQTLMTRVKLDGEVSIKWDRDGDLELDVSIPLLAPDPQVYGEERTYQVFPAGTGEGRVYPLYAPNGVRSYGNTVNASKALVDNRGTSDAYPVVIVEGSFPAGFRLTSGQNVVEYRGPVFPSSPVTVDMRRQSVTVDKMDRTHLVSKRGWFKVPKFSQIQPRISSLQPGNGHANFTIRDTYL